MNDIPSISTRGFLTRWIIVSFVVWPLAVILVSVSIMLMMVMRDRLPIPNGTEAFVELILLPLVFGAIAGTVTGFSIGRLQVEVIRRQVGIVLDRLARLSAIGGALGGAAMFFLRFSPIQYGYYLDTTHAWLTVAAIHLGYVSAAQWFSLRHVVRDAWLWILANIIGVLVWNAVPSEIGGWGFLLIPFLQGAVTGVTMLWLLGALRRDRKRKVDDTPDDQPEKHKPSVSEDAI